MAQFLLTICRIQSGEEHLREELIASQREFIRSFASFVCRKRLDWHNDDELSIALIAFNRAIDTFKAAAGENFLAYARVLMRNSLVDYHRSRQKQAGPADGATAALAGHSETVASLAYHNRDAANLERAYEIEIFKEMLARYDLTLESLVMHSPRHRDTRENLKAVALKVARDETLRERILREKRLPLAEIQCLSGAGRKMLEQWRKYLLSLLIIAAHGELEMLSEYIWGKEPVGRS